ncbi:IDLSRF-like peptide [Anastrepha obliqua]|uniref:IDLSRF-like peptide n=1 Tax=Anastrepha obliqua TaxID=95512 RepID=UPI002409AE11|nr:IDLSRF-like peptide [Anastrepha obliqua]
MDAAVSQGSVLGPLLYMIYNYNNPYLNDDSMIVTFADDTVLITSDRNINVASSKLQNLIDTMLTLFRKMANPEACHPYEPFKCPGDGNCISIQYLCDGAPDCSDGYDEDLRLCTAAKRPPVEETASFLQSLIASHGPNYLEKLFGSKARDALAPLGGVEKVAIALSESQTIEDFGAALHLMRSDLEHLRSVFMAVENGDLGMLKSLGIKDSELGDVKFFLEKLVNTGFLD